jgi:CheY-like chemotaxis protein
MYVKQILDSSEKATTLIQSLLAFSKRQVISLKPVNLNDIVRKTENLLIRVIGEDIKLRAILAEEAIIVMADSGLIEQAIINLATNSRDAMPKGGLLIIETGVEAIDDTYITSHGYRKAGEYALLSITDSGTGMSETTRERMFEPFFSTKEPGKGTGLGLSMVYGSIKQHDGFVEVMSESGEGSKIKIYIPLSVSDVDDPLITSPPLLPGGTETILIAEDDHNVRELTKNILEKFGYAVIEAEDGEDAVQKYYENKEMIHMLLLDVVMPKKNGGEVYDEIKKMNSGVKVLFMSGYSADIIQKKALLNKEYHFIPKPAPMDKLLIKIREVLDS